jgi:hypothetical protein
MILMSVFENIKRECFFFSKEWVMGHCSVGDAGRDIIFLLFIGWISDRNKV